MDSRPIPRIAAVAAVDPTTVEVRWKDSVRPIERINLAGWIATGRPLLDALRDEDAFRSVRLGDYGASIAWGSEASELEIDAAHLKAIADEQQPFGEEEARSWQKAAGLSNQEAADFLGLALSTWNLYRGGGSIPRAVALACRSSLRDPVLFAAHLRPRKAGRPALGSDTKQTDLMRQLVALHGRDRDIVVREFAKAEREGRVARKRNTYNLSADDYARRLWADGERKGWLFRERA